MLITAQYRTGLILVISLIFMACIAETASAEQSCSIVEVCKFTQIEKKEGGKLDNDAIDNIEENCDVRPHNSTCSLDRVIELCWEDEEFEDESDDTESEKSELDKCIK